jgi:hypothetical protein
MADQPNFIKPPLRSGTLQPAVFASELQRTNSLGLLAGFAAQ